MKYSEEKEFLSSTDLDYLIHEGYYGSTKCLLSDNGVFISCRKDKLHNFLSRYVFGENFYSNIITQAKQKHYGVSLSGLRVKKGELEKLHSKMCEVRKDSSILNKIRYNPKVIQVSPIRDREFRVTIEYVIVNYKVAAQFRKDKYEIEMVVKQRSDSTIEIYGDPKSSQDSMLIRDVATEIFGEVGLAVKDLQFDNLSSKDKVEFFDIILKKKSPDWFLDEVCGLSIRIDKDGNSSSDDGEDEEEFLGADDTRALSRVILEGKKLRSHHIVENLLKDDYYFYTATVWVVPAKQTNYKLKIRIEFKKRPNIPIITAESAQRYNSDTDLWEKDSIPTNLAKNCVRFFWDLIYDEYDKIMVAKLEKSKSLTKNNS